MSLVGGHAEGLERKKICGGRRQRRPLSGETASGQGWDQGGGLGALGGSWDGRELSCGTWLRCWLAVVVRSVSTEEGQGFRWPSSPHGHGALSQHLVSCFLIKPHCHSCAPRLESGGAGSEVPQAQSGRYSLAQARRGPRGPQSWPNTR